ncbi:MAG: ATP-binding cassette domain-containing protein, partial [Actinobacteria bacterium]|nr:ATP-binding cassette domain-containing protein [Actinomycetota bacterium]
FGAMATRARLALSRLTGLYMIERIERGAGGSKSEPLKFDFKAPARSGRVVFEMTGGRIEVGDPPKVLLEDAELWLERGEHVSLVGPNGAGKTTLIDTLAGIRPLAAGRLSTGHNVKLGHLSQHADEIGRGAGGRARTVIEACGIHTGLPPQKARALLGRFLFSGEDAEKPLDGLSGGERRRLSLAILVASGANVLILDEPTNHLDLESREALEDALLAFEGALLLVSHDRALLEAVGTRTVAVLDGTLRSYDGGWQEYVRVREERRLAERAPKKAKPPAPPKPLAAAASKPRPKPQPEAGPKGKPKSTAQAAGANCAGERLAAATAAAVVDGASANGGSRPAAVSKNARRRIRELEREIEQAEEALKQLEAELAEPSAWSTPERTAQSSERHAAAKRAVEEAFARWEVAVS